MTAPTRRIAVVQAGATLFDTPATLDRMAAHVDTLRGQQVELAVFPEAYIGGYPKGLDFGARVGSRTLAGRDDFVRYWQSAIEVPGPEVTRMAEMAASAHATLVVGVIERAGGTLYCTALTFGPDGALLARHRKLMPTASERLIWGQGDGSTLAAWSRPYGMLGGLICWEHWMPLARAAMHAQHEVIHIAQWPAVHERHQMASRTYAFEGQCFVVATGCVLTRSDVLDGFDSSGGDPQARRLLEAIPLEPYWLKDGGGAVIGPDANYLLEPSFGDPAMRLCVIDLARRDQAKLYLDTQGHYSRPDVFDLHVNTRANPGVRFLPG